MRRGIVLAVLAYGASLPCTAQMNALSPTERNNVQLILRNLNSLIDEGRQALPANPTSPSDIAKKQAAEKELDRLREIHTNLTNKFDGGHIHSVPGMKGGVPNKKYREDNNAPSTPTAAYCDDDTYIRNGAAWAQCPEGDIVVDHDVLDPGAGTAINEANQAGWQQKWTLLHVLAHEKMHEILINEQVDLLKSRLWFPGQPDQRKRQLIRDAKRKGATPEKHQEVYEWQKNVLRWKQALLERELKDLLHRHPPPQTETSAARAKIDWLKRERTDLERKMARATAEPEFTSAQCNIAAFPKGTIAVYVATRGLYWRQDVKKSGEGFTISIVESDWLNERTREGQPDPTPVLYVVMSDVVFTGFAVQPRLCSYVQEEIGNGGITTSSTRDGINGVLEKLTGLRLSETQRTAMQSLK